MKYKSLIVILGILALAFPSGAQTRVGFDGRIDKSMASRSDTKSIFSNGDSFGVFAYSTASEWNDDAPFGPSMFMYNVPVTKKAAAWSYDDKRWWKEGSLTSFYAYYPYSASIDATGSGGADNGAPVIAFAPDPDRARQTDLLYAAPLENRKWDGLTSPDNVSFKFRHALSQIRIMVSKYNSLPYLSQEYKVTKVRISGMKGEGSLNLRTGKWDTSAGTAASYTIDNLPDVPVGTTSTEIMGAGTSGFFLIPQNVELMVEIWFTRDGAPYSDLPYTKTFSARNWQSNTEYNYHIVISGLDNTDIINP